MSSYMGWVLCRNAPLRDHGQAVAGLKMPVDILMHDGALGRIERYLRQLDYPRLCWISSIQMPSRGLVSIVETTNTPFVSSGF